MNDHFYRDLISFNDFSGIGEFEGYQPVPDDWVVLAADIVRSRDAIAQGRYKDVNLVGAAVISAVLNKLGREEIPFVFGGDGAIVLVPKSQQDAGREALAGVAMLAREDAGLDLRVAAIPVTDLRARGTDIKLRKFELSPGNYLAMAIGNGIELAERILKDEEAVKAYTVPSDQAEFPMLDGLSCRWEPIPSLNGKMLALIVRPGQEGLLPRIVTGMTEAIGFNPVSEAAANRIVTSKNLRFRFPPSSLDTEVQLKGRISGRLAYRLRALLECAAFVWGYVTKLRVGPFRPKPYLAEISRNTDHRKLDDSLRMVLDLSESQIAGLKHYLETACRSGDLVYGLHESPSALMTCFVTDLAQSQHIHFVDGADGGFAAAAADLQTRLRPVARAGNRAADPAGPPFLPDAEPDASAAARP
ncbi:DUF3095 family protein [Roseibium sp. RKSG952]|uniref:DUF3095 family protein n=1 Tax=Roseibium sp. RKSG952 TaxID=2529384 RepID=UPI0012BC1EB4|nr:DUF3095 family protein [Roseibium sp. RKSG952]MTH96312.1 DUF3095 family protein [Roseibium sp. RKSG952]